MSEARYGVWSPVYGPWASRVHPEEPPQARYAINREVILEAERLGFSTVMIAQHIINPLNHDYDQVETWSTAAALAEATRTIELIAAVKPFLFHPAVLAKMALGIDAISKGRLAINLISGWYLPEMERGGFALRSHDERYRFSTEWLRIVKALWGDRPVTHEGAYFKLKDLQFHPGPITGSRPCVYLGGESEPARQLAAAEADIYLINGRPVRLIREVIADLSRRSRPAGSPPLRFGMAAFVIARPTAREAKDEFEYLAQLAARNEEDMLELLKGVDPNVEMFKTFAASEKGLGTNGGTYAELVGDYDTVARRIGAFTNAGIETFLLQFQPLIPEMRRFFNEVVPRVGRFQNEETRQAV